MARITGETGGGTTDQHSVSAIGHDSIALPDGEYITNAEILRDGQDLVLRHPDGATFTVEDYFSANPAPQLVSPQGAALGAEMVHSFVQPMHPLQYAQLETATDESPIGHVGEISGHATITHNDGSSESLTLGAPIYEGDIIETDAQGAVNISFIDETTFSVSNNARMAIDEYVFDPGSQSGETHFSVLRGMFVFVSGLIGRDDPDDVSIHTPVGSIGIRGTTIAGNVDTGQITVVEGAIVLRTVDGSSEITLAQQFETARFNSDSNTIEPMQTLSVAQLSNEYQTMQDVNPAFFTSISAPIAVAGADGTVESGAITRVASAEMTAPAAPATADAPAPGTDPAIADTAAQTITSSENIQLADASATLPPPPMPPEGYTDTSLMAAKLDAEIIGTSTISTATGSDGSVILADAGTLATGSSLLQTTTANTATLSAGTTTTLSGTATTSTAPSTTTTTTGTTTTTTSSVSVPVLSPTLISTTGPSIKAPVQHDLPSLTAPQGFHLNGSPGSLLGFALAGAG